MTRARSVAWLFGALFAALPAQADAFKCLPIYGNW